MKNNEYIIDSVRIDVYIEHITNFGGVFFILENKKERKRLNITLPPELIEELEKVNKKYKINKSSQIETLITKYLRKEYGDLG